MPPDKSCETRHRSLKLRFHDRPVTTPSPYPNPDKTNPRVRNLAAVRFRSRESFINFRIPWGNAHQTVPLHEEIGRAWLAAQYADICHEPPSQTALSQAVAGITNLSMIGSRKVDCPLRVHWDGNPRRPSTIYLDRRDYGDVVEITAAGYRVTCEHALDFRATFHEEPLPVPEDPAAPAEVLAKLRALLNLTANDRGWILCLQWLLAAFRPAGPYPPLVLHGPAASGKSGAARMLRALVDPDQMPLRAIPRSASALADLAWSNHVLAFDDVHRLPPVAESNLARLAAGGAFDLKVPRLKAPVAFSAARPLLFTTRNPRLDLGGRAIQVELREIEPAARRTEADLFDEFEALRPQLGAVLYSAVSAAIVNFGRISAPALPRHADAALWLLGAAPALALSTNQVLDALDVNPAEHSPPAAAPAVPAAANGKSSLPGAALLLATVLCLVSLFSAGAANGRSAAAPPNSVVASFRTASGVRTGTPREHRLLPRACPDPPPRSMGGVANARRPHRVRKRPPPAAEPPASAPPKAAVSRRSAVSMAGSGGTARPYCRCDVHRDTREIDRLERQHGSLLLLRAGSGAGCLPSAQVENLQADDAPRSKRERLNTWALSELFGVDPPCKTLPV